LTCFQVSHPAQRGLPVLLQLRGDQTVIGIAGSVAALGKRSLVAGLLQFQIEDLALIFLLFPMHSLCLERGLDRERFYRAQQLACNRRINLWPPKGHAPGQAHHEVGLVATINGSALRVARIGNAQSSSAPSARHDPRQQRPATPARLRAASAAIVVECQLLLVALVVFPTDVTLVVILDEHLPGPCRLSVPVTPPGTPVDDGGALLTLPVDVNARVKRILEHRDDIAVADREPGEAGHAALIGRPREVDLIRRHRQQHLAGAAEFAEAGKDQPDHFLQPEIRIEPQACFAMPDIAKRHREAQFAPARLRPGGIEHPRSEYAQLELADVALHAQEQAVIGQTRIVDSVVVDDTGFDKSAQLEQMMPVTAIAREPRCVLAQNGANLARTQPGNQAIEARARHGSARGSTEVVVDDLNVGEAGPARDINEIILPPLAFQVGHHLRLRRLAHIHDGLAREECRRDQFNAAHR